MILGTPRTGTPERPFREAVVDVGAISENVATLAALVAPAEVLAVVKAGGYGHGSIAAARAALAGGASRLGVVDVHEAMALRAAGIQAPILAWLHDPDVDFVPALHAEIELGISSLAQLERAAAAADRIGGTARVHLKIDTGLSRNGIPPEEWAAVLARAVELDEDRLVRVVGVFSHLANTDADSDAAQQAVFEAAVAEARETGLEPEVRHLAATAAAMRRPELRYDLVRLGIGIYGIPPFCDGTTSAEAGLRPAMTLRARVAAVRRIAAGTGVSYDHAWRTERDTTLALVPLGYADGIPRAVSGAGAEVLLGGRRHPIVGRIAMDQFLVDVGDAAVEVGDEVVLFGDPATGAPSADEFAAWAGTIGYELVTRIGPRVRRTYLGGAEGAVADAPVQWGPPRDPAVGGSGR
ncbi:alanine racemase [Agromyces seonyuensis]|uniref:Alanine racemase n=1 Tax=Agromyces seonyuensis TaxID=2662446 RepID=A0A6I4P814_9MICO|nr:alanine racemase [Agromyces seonyuensis]MWC00095.1 alanine racemase [Agromyces seonyuensis]